MFYDDWWAKRREGITTVTTYLTNQSAQRKKVGSALKDSK